MDNVARVGQIVEDTYVYYSFLAGRLEKILADMDENGAPPDHALRIHFSRLLDETRDLLRRSQVKVSP
ncbi:MAG: hypothetical protein ACOH12_13865 [Parvibaculaceae bacterium]